MPLIDDDPTTSEALNTRYFLVVCASRREEMMMGKVMPFTFSTNAFPDVEKFEAWQNQNTMGELRLSREGFRASSLLDGDFVGVHLGQVMLGHLKYSTKVPSDPITYDAIRTARRLKCDGIDHYFFRVSRFHVWQAKAETAVTNIKPGQIFMADLAKPHCIDIQAGEALMIMIPRDAIPGDLSPLHGGICNDFISALTAQYLFGLVDQIHDISHEKSSALSQSILGMLLVTVMPSSNNIEMARNNIEIELIRKIKNYIHGNVKNFGLGVDSICRDVGISRASLYRLFDGQNYSVVEYIKVCRLRRIYGELLASLSPRKRVSEIVASHGFYYNSSFVRLFKRYFGCAPSEVRNDRDKISALTIDPGCDASKYRDFKEWHKGIEVL
ncbi:AraC family transcriptional regulator [Burkholderia sp. SRS-46]|nr:AraC family transcriptional regulator [Burkholderia sp. SRS-46]